MMTGTADTCTPRSRWTQPFVLWGIATAVTGLAVLWLLKHEPMGPALRSALGFLPALMWILFIVALARGIRKLDEMGKRIHLQAASIAFLLTVILAYLFLGLDAAGLYIAKPGDIAGAVVLLWALVLIVVTRRYR
jgi:hypothetical protein